MPFNSNYKNNDNNDTSYEPSVFSGYTLKNPNGVDPSALSISYFRRMLKISIAPAIEMKPTDLYMRYDYANAVSIFLQPTAALIFMKEIQEYLKNPNAFFNGGIASGKQEKSGLISISNGKELGVDATQIIIRRVDSTGKVIASGAYQFNDPAYNRSLRNYDEQSLSYEEVPHENIEIEILLKHLEQFVNASTYAYAYSIMESNKKNSERLYDLARESSGGDMKSSSSRGSFFDKSSRHTGGIADAMPQTQPDRLQSLDDVADSLEAE